MEPSNLQSLETETIELQLQTNVESSVLVECIQVEREKRRAEGEGATRRGTGAQSEAEQGRSPLRVCRTRLLGGASRLLQPSSPWCATVSKPIHSVRSDAESVRNHERITEQRQRRRRRPEQRPQQSQQQRRQPRSALRLPRPRPRPRLHRSPPPHRVDSMHPRQAHCQQHRQQRRPRSQSHRPLQHRSWSLPPPPLLSLR